MKASLYFTTLGLVLLSPQVDAKTELEILRAKCQEQERQIRQMEEEKAHLTNAPEPKTKVKPAETVSSVVSAPSRAASPVATGSAAYKVKPGDSLAKIARKTGTTPEQLAKNNGLKSNSIIQPGQELKVPGSAKAAAVASETKKSEPKAVASNGKTHKVKQGETYSAISRKYGVSTAALIAANPGLKPTGLRPGQIVNLSGNKSEPSTTTITTPVSRPTTPAAESKPVSHSAAQNIPVSTPMPKAAAKSAAAPKPAPEPEPVAKKEAPAPAAEKKIQPVTIDGEITYGEFAAKHGTDADRLNALNGLDLTTATVLAKGSELYVPAQP